MFANTPQSAGSSTNSTRSRRRQRPLSNEGSIAQPKPKRLRSALSEQTFQAPNGDAAPEMEEVKEKAASIVKRESTREILTVAPRREIAVRGKKGKSGDRVTKGDGSVVLVSSMAYDYVHQCLAANNKRARLRTISIPFPSSQPSLIDSEQKFQLNNMAQYTPIAATLSRSLMSMLWSGHTPRIYLLQRHSHLLSLIPQKMRRTRCPLDR